MNEPTHVEGATAPLLTLRGKIDPGAQDARQETLRTVESGGIVYLPDVGFELTANERELISDTRASLGLPAPDAHTGRPTIMFDRALSG